jgi:hypothetical protein
MSLTKMKVMRAVSARAEEAQRIAISRTPAAKWRMADMARKQGLDATQWGCVLSMHARAAAIAYGGWR